MNNKLSMEEKNTIEAFANHVHDSIKELSNVSKSPYDLIPKIGNNIILIRYPSMNDFSGLSFKLDSFNCIYINSDTYLARQHFTCWHEFFHLIRDSSDSIEKEEIEADYFASCMLMSEDSILNYVYENHLNIKFLTLDDLIVMQHKFQVSLFALIIRLNNILATNRYGHFIPYDTIEKNKDLVNKTIEVKKSHPDKKFINESLIIPTNDFIIPQFFLEALIKVTKLERIAKEKANDILNFINEEGVVFK